MVFNLTAKKKRSYKVLPKPKKYAPVQHAHNVLHQLPTSQQSHDTPDPAMYRKLSSTRAIFESNKLESACSFLKSLKEKLENDIDGNGDDILLEGTPTNDTITSILDTLIDVSDNISPIVSDVSESTKSIYRRPTPMQSSSISEKHFNKTMLATNKLIELSTRSKNAADVTGGTYYFAHKIVANNMEELSIFKHSIMSIGDKIYIDKSLLAQMVELHTLLKDTITKLKLQEAECLSGSKANDESLTNHLIADDITSTPSKNVELGDSQKPTTSTPTSQSVTKLTADVSSITENARNSTLCYTAPTNIPVATKKISPSNTPPSKKKTKIPCFKKKKSPTTISFPSKKEPTTKKPNTSCSAAKTKSASATTDKIKIANASTTPQEFLVTGSPTSSILTTDKMNKKQLKNTELEPAQVLSVGKMRSKYETALDSTAEWKVNN